jgi:hypothetical protein
MEDQTYSLLGTMEQMPPPEGIIGCLKRPRPQDSTQGSALPMGGGGACPGANLGL